MKLYGSTTSPYVRRLRVWLEDVPHEFVNIDIYSPEGRVTLKQINPALKVPMLVDDWQAVFDSRVIYNYLNHKLGKEVTTIDDENAITLINAANDSYIELFQLSRSGIDIEQDALFFNLQHERIASTLSVLNEQAKLGAFEYWHFPAICLYCLVDWLMFRGLNDFSAYPDLQAFHQRHAAREILQDTDPRA
ncbi:glutathione S-transferase family protein [Nitrincola sp.]|uniref:glutathione S-transferase family protein n=1 Tax=Nitrincola sp. TaxID=1926584 RepID=UPI003A943383